MWGLIKDPHTIRRRCNVSLSDISVARYPQITLFNRDIAILVKISVLIDNTVLSSHVHYGLVPDDWI